MNQYSQRPADEKIALPLYPGAYGPAIADQLAALIVRHWRELIRTGEFEATHHLDIVDLCPGDGRSGTMLCAAINRRIQGLPQIRFRYLPVLPAVDPPSGSFQVSIDPPGTVCPMRWDILDPSSSPHLSGYQSIYRSGNSIVLLAYDAWTQLPQELYAIHYGKLLRADLDVIKAGKSKQEKQQLWSDAPHSAWGEQLAPMLAHYLLELNSSPIVFAASAFDILANLFDVSNHDALVIAVCDGHSQETHLRLTSFAELIDAYRNSEKLPVNFQLIANWLRAHGGEVVDISVSKAFHLQLSLVGKTNTVQRLQAIASCVDAALFAAADHFVEICKHLSQSVSLEARLNLLQISRYDPKVFAAEDKQIIQALAQRQEIDRDAWRLALLQVWKNHQLYPTDPTLHRSVSSVAMHCNHWNIARAVLQHALQGNASNSEDLANLAWCEVRTGNLMLGKSLVEQALSLDPANALASEVNRRIAQRLAIRDTGWMVELRHSSLPIVLEPLDDSHADAYWRQYRDPQIAVMTGLPAMNTLQDVRDWIKGQQEESERVNFAVMHQDFGFVGFINLSVSEHAAFFCFWTGVDFQGAGFATAAGRLACQYAVSQGVPIMLTSAYKDNHRSIRALGRIGFNPMSIRAHPPDQDRVFFSLIDSSAGHVNHEIELVEYYARENLPLKFVGYESAETSSQSADRQEAS